MNMRLAISLITSVYKFHLNTEIYPYIPESHLFVFFCITIQLRIQLFILLQLLCYIFNFIITDL